MDGSPERSQVKFFALMRFLRQTKREVVPAPLGTHAAFAFFAFGFFLLGHFWKLKKSRHPDLSAGSKFFPFWDAHRAFDPWAFRVAPGSFYGVGFFRSWHGRSFFFGLRRWNPTGSKTGSWFSATPF